jgi:hypothetical protein
VTWNTYNHFMDTLGSGGHLFPVLAVLVALMILVAVKSRGGRRA